MATIIQFCLLVSPAKIFLELCLLDSDLSVIDINDYQNHAALYQAFCSLFQKGCCVEVSPDGQFIDTAFLVLGAQQSPLLHMMT